MSSGTSLPASMYRRASMPSGVPSRTAARNRSPVATIGIPSRSARIGACVPFPAPGGPSRMTTFIPPSARMAFDANDPPRSEATLLRAIGPRIALAPVLATLASGARRADISG